MGSISSGRHDRVRRFTTEEVACIDVRQIFRSPLLTGHWSPCPLSNARHQLPLYYQAAGDQITIGSYKGSHLQEIGRLMVTWSSRNFGGRQPYFICPESHCRKRVAVLYLTNKIACRTCSNLGYESQHEIKHLRLMRRASKLRKKLGAPARLLAPIPEKPKRMHQETYEQAVFMIHALELQAVKSMQTHLAATLGQKLGFLDSLCS